MVTKDVILPSLVLKCFLASWWFPNQVSDRWAEADRWFSIYQTNWTPTHVAKPIKKLPYIKAILNKGKNTGSHHSHMWHWWWHSFKENKHQIFPTERGTSSIIVLPSDKQGHSYLQKCWWVEETNCMLGRFLLLTSLPFPWGVWSLKSVDTT